ncbi:MAG: S41 family peptidase [Pirellulales bacterium]
MKSFGTWCLILVSLLAASSAVSSSARLAKAQDAAAGDKEAAPAKEASAAAEEKSKRDQEELELLRLLVDTLDQVERNYVKDVSRRELYEAAIRGLLTKLDQHSNYIPPSELESFRGSVESEFGGIGIQVTIEGGRLIVISPIVGTPAYRAGIQAGDWISAIDGKSTREITIDEAVKRMKGRLGTKVQVTVVHARNGESETLSIERDTVRVETVLGDRRKSDDSWDYFLDRDKKIGYLRITTFGRHTTQEVRKAIKQLTADGLRGLVIDLRFNPGGLLTSAIEISDLFVSQGRIVSTVGRNVPEQVVYATEEGTYADFPIAVLVNRFSASASEIVAACLQDHERAVVVGERTWGKGSVQNIIELEGGKSALKLTTAGYQRPNGRNIHRFEGATDEDEWGVKPNQAYEVKLSEAELRQWLDDRQARDIVRQRDAEEAPRADADKQLAKALEYLAKKLGDAPAEKAADKKEEPSEKKDDASSPKP